MPGISCCGSRAVIDAVRDVVHDPVESFEEVLPCHGAAWEDPPLMGLDRIQVDGLE